MTGRRLKTFGVGHSSRSRFCVLRDDSLVKDERVSIHRHSQPPNKASGVAEEKRAKTVAFSGARDASRTGRESSARIRIRRGSGCAIDRI